MGSRISFRIIPHSRIPDVEIVEVLLDGHMCASIYPDRTNEGSIKLVSAHFAGELTHNDQFPEGVKMDTGDRMIPPIPAVHISFDVRPYTIEGNTIVRLPE